MKVKKILSVLLSVILLTSGISLNTFSAYNNQNLNQMPMYPMYPYYYQPDYYETKFLRKIGLNKLADTVDNALTALNRGGLSSKIAIVSIITYLASAAGGISDSFVRAAQGFYYLKHFAGDIFNSFKNKVSSHQLGDVSPEKALRILNIELNSLKGQKKIKDSINNVVAEILYGKEMAKIKDKKYDHGDIIYMPGPSGVGKTFASLRIARALSPVKPLILSASEVDIQRKQSIVQQLFRFNDYEGYNEPEKKISLVDFIRNNKNGVVIINEYDKMWNKALDEILRTVADQGIISINGHALDCSGITFIITSNESSASVNGGNQDTDKNIDDGTGSRTSVDHDKSFMNRVKIIEFENLSKEDYEEIIMSEYDSKYFEYWENLLNIKIDVGDTPSCVAQKVFEENKGARTIKNVFSKLISKMIQLKSQLKDIHQGDERPTYLLSYDKTTDTFSLTLKENTSENKKSSQSENTLTAFLYERPIEVLRSHTNNSQILRLKCEPLTVNKYNI